VILSFNGLICVRAQAKLSAITELTQSNAELLYGVLWDSCTGLTTDGRVGWVDWLEKQGRRGNDWTVHARPNGNNLCGLEGGARSLTVHRW